jgi:hypothetical protein
VLFWFGIGEDKVPFGWVGRLCQNRHVTVGQKVDSFDYKKTVCYFFSGGFYFFSIDLYPLDIFYVRYVISTVMKVYISRFFSRMNRFVQDPRMNAAGAQPRETAVQKKAFRPIQCELCHPTFNPKTTPTTTNPVAFPWSPGGTDIFLLNETESFVVTLKYTDMKIYIKNQETPPKRKKPHLTHIELEKKGTSHPD